MITIHKYPINQDKIIMPKGAEILALQTQKEILCIWVLVDTKAPLESRKFIVIGTGARIFDITKLNYIGTWQEANGCFIWHLFEELT